MNPQDYQEIEALIDGIDDTVFLNRLAALINLKLSGMELHNVVLKHGGTEETVEEGRRRNLEFIMQNKGE